MYGYRLEKAQTEFALGDEYAKLALTIYHGEKSNYQGEEYISWTQLLHVVWQSSPRQDNFDWYGMKVEVGHSSSATAFEKMVSVLNRIKKDGMYHFNQQPDDFVEWFDNRVTHRVYFDNGPGELVLASEAAWNEMTLAEWVAEPTWKNTF